MKVVDYKIKFKLLCTVTMRAYSVKAESMFAAKRILATKLSVPIDCIIPYVYE